tara:strand:- start:191 stop:1222 length:1032 start_codon:yes stop_codon:yes gene_type:complete
MISSFISLAEKGFVPDFLIKIGIEKLCNERLNWCKSLGVENLQKHNNTWISKLKNSPIALVPEKANEQHYEVPPEFFEIVLGKHLKYSCGLWENNNINLDQSERDMLEKYIHRAELKDSLKILELGCGWGSLTLFMAKKFPKAQITAVSNSNDQRKFIQNKCKKMGFENVDVITCDMNDFHTDKKFDRVVSIEMFEHMRNYKVLLKKISNWLNDTGKLFVHIFSHNSIVYPYEDKGPGDWMSREFFSGGLMPSHELLLNFQDDLKIEKHWKVSGMHYSLTSYAWLDQMDLNKSSIINIFEKAYGKNQSKIWFQRWRIFFLACAVMFSIKSGTEWGVSHYRFRK